jgi:antitoxin MazE
MAAAQGQMVKWGNSLAVRIPKNIADEAQLSEGDKLLLETAAPGNVIIRAVERPTLDQLLERITEENLHKEIDWGKPVGNESW